MKKSIASRRFRDKKDRCNHVILLIVLAFISLTGCLGRQHAVQPENSAQRKTPLHLQEKIKTESSVPNKRDAQPQPTRSQSLAVYDQVVERLLLLKPAASSFEVEVWTDKPVYQIGEAVTFYFRSSRDAYLTLLDVGTSGNLRILFPNKFQKEKRVTAGRIYTVPERGASFIIEADGPPGLEWIKGIATSQPMILVEGEPTGGFLVISREQLQVQSEIQSLIKQLGSQIQAEGSAEITITEEGKSSRFPGRSRTIKPKKPEKPIDITGTAGFTEEKNKKDLLDLSPTKAGETD